VRYWAVTGILLLAFLLQSVVSNYLAIQGIAPNFLVATAATYGLLFGWEVGLAGGMAGGLLLDLMSGNLVGLHVLSYGVVGLLAGLVEPRVFKENMLLGPVAGLVLSIVSQTIEVTCRWLFGAAVSPWDSLRFTLLPAALYDMVITALVYSRIYKHYQYLKPDPRGTIVLWRR
jgi:rod shape-determining protein MreD